MRKRIVLIVSLMLISNISWGQSDYDLGAINTIQMGWGAYQWGSIGGNILSVTHEFASVPTAATAVIDGVTFAFHNGDMIRVHDANVLYVREGEVWQPFSGSTTINTTTSGALVSVSDKIMKGAERYTYNLSTAAMNKTFIAGTPIVRLDIGSELTPYIEILNDWDGLIGGVAGFAIDFDSPMDETRVIRVIYGLESLNGSIGAWTNYSSWWGWIQGGEGTQTKQKFHGLPLDNELGTQQLIRRVSES